MLDSPTPPSSSAASPRTHTGAARYTNDPLPLHSIFNESQDPSIVESLLRTALWILRVFILYLGHPILFLCYLFTLSGKKISGIETFTKPDTDVYKINMGLYVALTLPVFLYWLLVQLIVLNNFPNFDMDRFLKSETSLLSEIIAIPGIVNLWTFATDGMEQDVFCCFFFIPLVLASIGYAMLWFIFLAKSFYSP